jgi:ElaB/YqjD/DUF883 family membrane-anchored ribosome-binding protein
MATDTSHSPREGAIAEMKGEAKDLVGGAQEQVSAKAHELGGEARLKLREQLDQRSTQAGEQVRSIGKALQSGAGQLRSEGQDTPARLVDELAQRADVLGGYLQSAHADRILDDVEGFARRRPWVTAGAGALAGFLASRFLKASGERRSGRARTNGRASLPPTQPSLTPGGM